jgi:putative membrane protein
MWLGNAAAHMWFGDAWGLFGTLAALAFVALVVVAIAALLRSGGRVEDAARSSAHRLLEERYARGEISRQEFTERREVLRSPRPADEP